MKIFVFFIGYSMLYIFIKIVYILFYSNIFDSPMLFTPKNLPAKKSLAVGHFYFVVMKIFVF